MRAEAQMIRRIDFYESGAYKGYTDTCLWGAITL